VGLPAELRISGKSTRSSAPWCGGNLVAGTYDDAKKVAARFANDRNIRFDGGARTIAGKESMKTIAFEIAEDLSLACGTRVGSGTRGNYAWSAPDWYIQAVSGGIGPLGVHKGFTELHQMGLIDHVPKIGVIQVSGCAPMARAFAGNRDKAVPLVPDTAITILSTGDPGFAYELLLAANKTYGGSMIDVDEEAAYAALDHLAKSEGCAMEPAAAVAFAGLEKLCRRGVIGADETVVVNCSGHSFPP
jgi:threonine synthase